MNNLQDKVEKYAKTVARLLKGDMDSNDKLWNDLLNQEQLIHQYVNQIGLELILMRDDGYAYLRQFHIDEKGNTIGLKPRMPIGFEASVVCVVLREVLREFEDKPTQIVREKYLTHGELVETIEHLFQKQRNRKTFLKDLDTHLKTVVRLGFLEKMDKNSDAITPNTKYQIKKIIKSKISLNDLSEFKQKLSLYVESI